MKSWIRLAVLTAVVAGCDRAPNPSSSTQEPSPAPPKAAIAMPPASLTTPTEDEVVKALGLKRDGKIAEARALLQQLAATNASDQVYAALSELDTLVLFSPTPAPEKTDYTVA